MNSNARHPITFKRVLYRVAGMESVRVRRDIPYGTGEASPLTFDLYQPPAAADARPVVFLVTGYPDIGGPRPLGCAFKEMEMSMSMGQVLAASGVSAVAYTTRAPEEDLGTLLDYFSTHAATLDVDQTRIGLWSTSGNGPVALAAVARHAGRIAAAVFSTAFMLDDESSAVADAARAYGFVNASAGLSIEHLPENVPLLVVRGGRDEVPGLNHALDSFAAAALAHNRPITIVNHATGGHAFELHDDSEPSKHVIGQMLEFMRFWLRV
jgi:hypothetical protein